MRALAALTAEIARCQRCPRLVAHLAVVRSGHPGYHARPVLPFGATSPRLVVVGLAPGLHGANRTGRPFTGDHAGVMLYETLHRFGFSSRPVSEHADDGLHLIDCRITNAVKCLPPGNRPDTEEMRTCNVFLAEELRQAGSWRAVLALGRVAHDAVLRALGIAPSAHRFGHGLRHALPGGQQLFDSYHCSRYNTQTRRLSAEMFAAVFDAIRREFDGDDRD